MKNCLFSVDVEEWFHILELDSHPNFKKWDKLPSRVENNFHRLLKLFSQKNVKVTCFFLGWIAEKYPQLVRTAYNDGHEIASHGYSHELIYNQSQDEFYNDIVKSKQIIESIVDCEVLGYRAPGFSYTQRTPWFYKTLIRAGFSYDSSVFPIKRQHGGINTDVIFPSKIELKDDTFVGNIIEIPISISKILLFKMCFFGGGYFRLFPYKLIKNRANKIIFNNNPVIFYIHPRDIDTNQPILKMGIVRKFKTYINLEHTIAKLDKLFDGFQFITFESFVKENF